MSTSCALAVLVFPSSPAHVNQIAWAASSFCNASNSRHKSGLIHALPSSQPIRIVPAANPVAINSPDSQWNRRCRKRICPVGSQREAFRSHKLEFPNAKHVGGMSWTMKLSQSQRRCEFRWAGCTANPNCRDSRHRVCWCNRLHRR